MKDRNDQPLKTGDQVKYVGDKIATMPSDPRPNVSRGDKGKVEGEFSSTMIWVKFNKGGDRIQISRYRLEKI